jgi:lipid A 4'-phosphatase
MPQWARALIGAGRIAGLAAGLVRMAQGAHCLSDVVFAGVFMVLTVGILWVAMFTKISARRAQGREPAVGRPTISERIPADR